MNLTEREMECLRLVADGLTDAEIGAKLFLSRYTVKTHITKALQRCGAKNRPHMVALAFRAGLIDAAVSS